MSRIRGEYWIQDGHVSFADGDIGDYDHEAIATNHFANKYIDELIDISHNLDLDIDFHIDQEFPVETVNEIRNNIIEAVENNKINWEGKRTGENVDNYLMKELQTDTKEYHCIFGHGDARYLVIEREGWIAVRSNNVEVYDFNNEKKKHLIDGIEEILEAENIDDPDDKIEIYIFDYKTKKSWDLSLEELKNSNSMRPVTLPNTTYNKPLFIPSNKPKLSKPIDAKTRSIMNTSESANERTLHHRTIIDKKTLDFKEWLAFLDK
jgi:hypothetical protein